MDRYGIRQTGGRRACKVKVEDRGMDNWNDRSGTLQRGQRERSRDGR